MVPALKLADIGRVVQIAFVPRDFDAALNYWTKVIGAGPFYHLEHIVLDNTRYRGAPANVDLSAALGYWGDIQIELVKQHDDSPSIYRDWLKSGREGVQHIGVVLDDYDQFDSAHAKLRQDGGDPIMETEIVNATRAAYFQMPGEDPLIEILALQPHFLKLWDHMRSTSVNWDGSAPLRSVPAEEVWAI
jgi:hypothetical protein